MNQSAKDQLDRLLGYLAADPDNPTLLIDAIEAAFDANALDQAEHLSARLSGIRPGSFEAGYHAAKLAMMRRDFASAAALLDPLVSAGAPPNARFNLAWSKAMIGDKVTALALLDSETIGQIADAAMLRTQLLHEAGDFEAALACGQAALESHPGDPGLNAAVATLALDLQDLGLARACSARGGDHPEALAAAGMLEMHDGDPAGARISFDRAIAVRQHNPRAWIGRGLAKLSEHDHAGAAADLDRGAQQFSDHIGSWIAAGWAHYLSGDLEAALQRFEKAMKIDPNFAQSHGSLAVVQAAGGQIAEARRSMEIAFRLDRQCFSAVLAKIMLDVDDPAVAKTLVARAFDTPLNESGMTVATYVTGLTRPTLH
ncbi:MAG: tetratricopeptide repeat protein [Novosphingobium sp.]|uniref:tetratricopeptide repeat protein n=1 Tax=Novosphingobium sp. TaxID=1874826 RepID=UPI0032B790DC